MQTRAAGHENLTADRRLAVRIRALPPLGHLLAANARLLQLERVIQFARESSSAEEKAAANAFRDLSTFRNLRL